MMDVTLVYEGGGSRTRLGVYGPDDIVLRHAEGGPCNPFDLGVDRCAATMAALAHEALQPDERPRLACAALAGAISGADAAAKVAACLCTMFGLERMLVTNDLYPILLANAGLDDAVLAIAGTGSSVMAQSGSGTWEMTGGRGVLFGDRGSAYALAAAGLRAAGEAFDGITAITALVEALPRAVGASGIPELVVWSRKASKTDVARLGPVVTALAANDLTARRVVVEEACAHADHTLAGGRKVGVDPSCAVICHGGVFEGSSLFFESFVGRMRECGHEGPIRKPSVTGTDAVFTIMTANAAPGLVMEVRGDPVADVLVAPTEAISPGITLDALSPYGIVGAMSAEDGRAVHAVVEESHAVARAIEAAANAVRLGGRVLYVGAGTSGRLGVLDASECPPTFGVAADCFIGIVAGGDRALRDSIEGAEDDEAQGQADLRALTPGISSRDLVVGIAASGTTPYTLAALAFARSCGAVTVLLCCNPMVRSGADIVVALHTGPEVVAGSTRLKAGTATKLVLNMISTGAMALSGHVYGGLMVGVRPVNAKLWRRATGIVEALAGCSRDVAEQSLRDSGDHVPTAIVMAYFNLSRIDAEQRLQRHGGLLRGALEG